LQPSDSREDLLADVERELRELEGLCGTLERALMRRDWSGLAGAIADSRRVTHGLQNAMDDAAGVRDEQFDEAVRRRLRHIEGIRNNQMARLQQYQKAVGERLQLMSRWKSALRSMGPRSQQPRLRALDTLS